jgi:Ankyrin repeats (many copies)
MFRSNALMAAGFAGMPTLLKLLLDFQAKPNDCNPEGLTALQSVARTHNTECAALLVTGRIWCASQCGIEQWPDIADNRRHTQRPPCLTALPGPTLRVHEQCQTQS